MMMTQNGKLLYISDNAAEYLGHSMVSEDYSYNSDGFKFARFWEVYVFGVRRCNIFTAMCQLKNS